MGGEESGDEELSVCQLARGGNDAACLRLRFPCTLMSMRTKIAAVATYILESS